MLVESPTLEMVSAVRIAIIGVRVAAHSQTVFRTSKLRSLQNCVLLSGRPFPGPRPGPAVPLVIEEARQTSSIRGGSSKAGSLRRDAVLDVMTQDQRRRRADRVSKDKWTENIKGKEGSGSRHEVEITVRQSIEQSAGRDAGSQSQAGLGF